MSTTAAPTSAGRSVPPSKPRRRTPIGVRATEGAPSRSFASRSTTSISERLRLGGGSTLLDRARQVGRGTQALDLVPALRAIDQVPLEGGSFGVGQSAQQVGAHLVPVCRVITCGHANSPAAKSAS